MKFRLEIECDNAAFEGLRCTEIARILREVARRVEDAGAGKAVDVRDINGNTVGQFSLMP